MIELPEEYEPYLSQWWDKNIQKLIDGEES